MKKHLSILYVLFCSFNISFAQQPKLVLPIGHTIEDNSLQSVIFSPDRKYLMTKGYSAVRLWQVSTGKLLYTLEGYSGGIYASDYSSDGKYIVTSGNGPTKVWEASTGKLKYLLDSCEEVRSCFSPNAKYLATTCENQGKLWDVLTGRLLYTLTGHANKVDLVRFSSDGKYLVTTAEDTTAKIWKVVDGSLVTTLKGHTDNITFANFSHDDKFIVTSSLDGTAKIWKVNSGMLLHSFLDDIDTLAARTQVPFLPFEMQNRKKPVIYANFSPDNKYIVTLSYGKQAKLWIVDSEKIFFRFHHSGFITDVCFSPDGKCIVTGSVDSSAKVWDLATGNLIYCLRTDARISSIDITSNNNVSSTTDHSNLYTWDLQNGKLLKNQIFSGQINSPLFCSFSSDEKFILTPSSDKAVKIWDLKNGRIIKSLSSEFRRSGFSTFGDISRDGNYIASVENHLLKITEVSSEKSFVYLKNQKVVSATISSNAKYLLITSFDSVIQVLNVSSHELIKTFKGYQGIFMNAHFSFDGENIVSGMITDTGVAVKVWNILTGKQIFNLEFPKFTYVDPYITKDNNYVTIMSVVLGHETTTNKISVWNIQTQKQALSYQTSGSYAISPDSKSILIISDHDNMASIYDLKNGKIFFSLKGHKCPLIDVKFSDDGKYILTTSYDNTCKIWDGITGNLLHTLEGHVNFISAAAFSPTGKFIVTTSVDGISRLWDTNKGILLYSFVSIAKNEYLTLDSVNRFDGSEKARNLLYYVCGTEVIDLDQFKNLSWEPGLVSKIMGVNKEPITAKGISEINICNYTPKVEDKEYKNGAYNFDITPQSGGLGEVLLYVNDKHIKSYSTDQLMKKNELYQLSVTDAEVKDYLVSGQENKVEVVALTADKEMTSQRGSITVTEPLDHDAPVHLYAISVGISKYKDDKLKLAYASKDADDFSGVLSKSAKKFLNIDTAQHVFSYTFSTNDLDQWPSKENIKKAFEEVAKKATANDILVLFFAGHGALKSMDRQFYFLTQEASSFGLAGVEKEVAISTEELNDWMRNIKAQKQILVLDACSSGEVVTDMQQLITKREIPADQQRALERLKDRTGTYILSASASGQSAYESGLYEQGLLTYGLLSGLKYGTGLKDNKFIDVTKWFNSAADEVKVLATDIGGRQDPQIIGSASFDVGIVDRSISDSIQLTSKKKVFKRSRFIGNQELVSDDLEVGSMLDKELKELSATGMESPLVYADDDNYSGSYSLRGTYSIKNKQLVINATLFKGQKDRVYQFQVKGKVEEKEKLVSGIVEKVKGFIEK